MGTRDSTVPQLRDGEGTRPAEAPVSIREPGVTWPATSSSARGTFASFVSGGQALEIVAAGGLDTIRHPRPE